MIAAELALLAGSVHSVYERNIIHSGREAEFLFFVAFLITFSFIRSSAYMIKKQVSWWPGNVEVGGTHIHHMFWGILLLLIFGWIGITQDLHSPWTQIVAVVFGIGAGLTLDEFALWLTLKDVYWEKEGRRSIDAVLVVTAVTALLLIGLRGWIEATTDIEHFVFSILGLTWLITIAAGTVCVTKGKYALALLGLFINLFSIVGAIRLARPTSVWAQRRYDADKLARAVKRFEGKRGPLDWVDGHLHTGVTDLHTGVTDLHAAEREALVADPDPASGRPGTDSAT